MAKIIEVNGLVKCVITAIASLALGGGGTWTIMRQTIAEQAALIAVQVTRIDAATTGLAAQQGKESAHAEENQRFHEMVSKQLTAIQDDLKFLIKEKTK
jgi:hypothetical protein